MEATMDDGFFDDVSLVNSIRSENWTYNIDISG